MNNKITIKNYATRFIMKFRGVAQHFLNATELYENTNLNKPKTNALHGTRCYLSGPIEFGEGPNWRTEVKKTLMDRFQINYFDPFDDPKQQWAPALELARKQKDLETIQRIAKPFVRKDLCIVDRSDFIISHLPYGVPTTGTHHEIIESSKAKKPTLLVCSKGVEWIAYWYYGFIPLEHMFGSWDELYTYLDEVNQGQHTYDNRWQFVYGLI